MSYKSNNHYQGNSDSNNRDDSYYSTPTTNDAMRSNQQPNNYAMQEMSSSHQRNAQRDTYGIPYDTNGYNPNYQQQQEQYYYAASQQHRPQDQYDHDQYYDNYHAAGGNGTSNNAGGHYDATEQQQQLQQPQYYNGYDRNSVQPLANQGRTSAQQNRSGGSNSRPSSMQSNSYKNKALKEERPRSKCLPCFPCIRSTCGRFTCCFFLLLLLAIIALVIVVFTVFKIPTVDYMGLNGEPTFAFNQGNATLAINFVANIQVKNPDPIGFNFEKVVATV